MLAAVGRDRSLSTTKPLLDSPSQPRRSLSASSPLGRYSASAHDDDAPAEPPPPASWVSVLCTLARRALVVLCVLAAGRGVWAARAHLAVHAAHCQLSPWKVACTAAAAARRV